jgi:tetraprenyl-beta-curcumene synthase
MGFGLRRSGMPAGPLGLMYRMYRHVLPAVYEELGRWRARAEAIPDPELRTQALASMSSKQFHCEGGAVFAAAAGDRRDDLVTLIVALQTISDYLDNLCDRSTSLDPDDFRLLHRAMLDAVDPIATTTDYYAHRAEREDGGYLAALVTACQGVIRRLPGYAAVRPHVARLAGLYADLQVYKHIRHEERLASLQRWWALHRADHPELLWNEFSAAAGSTLGMFALFVEACRPDAAERDAERTVKAYFPYLCGLHILLDYLIDQEEDRIGGDLNFCSYYVSDAEMLERIRWIADEARRAADRLPCAKFHRMVIEGLLAVYLSDPKAARQPVVRFVARELMRNSPMTRLFFRLNALWIRRRGKPKR